MITSEKLRALTKYTNEHVLSRIREKAAEFCTHTPFLLYNPVLVLTNWTHLDLYFLQFLMIQNAEQVQLNLNP